MRNDVSSTLDSASMYELRELVRHPDILSVPYRLLCACLVYEVATVSAASPEHFNTGRMSESRILVMCDTALALAARN